MPGIGAAVELQLAFHQAGVEGQGMAQRCSIVALAALGFAGQGKQALAIEAGVVLPQVVEHHLWPGLPVKHCPGRRRAEIA